MEDIARAEGMSNDELLVEIGKVGFEAAPQDPLERGRQVYANLRRTLADRICLAENVRSLAADQNRKPELIGMLADLIASLTHGVPVAALSVLLVRDGLAGLCADHWHAS